MGLDGHSGPGPHGARFKTSCEAQPPEGICRCDVAKPGWHVPQNKTARATSSRSSWPELV